MRRARALRRSSFPLIYSPPHRWTSWVPLATPLATDGLDDVLLVATDGLPSVVVADELAGGKHSPMDARALSTSLPRSGRPRASFSTALASFTRSRVSSSVSKRSSYSRILLVVSTSERLQLI